MANDDQHDDALDLALRRVLTEAYLAGMDVEVAARHLWRLREESERIAATGSAAPRHRRTRAPQRVAALLSAIFLFAMSGVAVAGSGHALPGEILYPVKRGTERMQLLAAWRPAADAELSLRLARLRLSEAATVGSTRPSWAPRLLADAVRSLDRAEELGGATVASEAAAVRHEAGQALVALASSSPEVSGELAVLAERLVGSAATAPAPAAPPPAEDPASAGADRPSTTSGTGDRLPPAEPSPARQSDEVPPRREVARGDGPPADPSAADEVEAPADGDSRDDGDGSAPEPGTPPPSTESTPSSSAGGTGGSADEADGAQPPPTEHDAGAGGGEAGRKHMPSTSQLAARFDAREGGSEPHPET